MSALLALAPAAPLLRNAMTGIGFCAGAASGHEAAAPRPAMNSRRFICVAPRPDGAIFHAVCKPVSVTLYMSLTRSIHLHIRRLEHRPPLGDLGLLPSAERCR